MVGSILPSAVLFYSDCSVDALKGMGHACGHNLIAVASLAGAVATARLMQDERLGGKVVLFGTPAEGMSGRLETFLGPMLLMNAMPPHG